jgi:hypothetical protein
MDSRHIVASFSSVLPVTMDVPQGTARAVAWGGINIGHAEIRQSIDLSPFLKGLPDDRRLSNLWGYVPKGRMRFTFADREEVYKAGDIYYVEPGHSVALKAGCAYLEFRPADEADKTSEVVRRNFEAATGS